VTTAGPDQIVPTGLVNVIQNVTTAATDLLHTTVTAALSMPYVIMTQKTVSTRSAYVTNGGQEKTVASIVVHAPQPVMVAQDQVLMNVRTVLKTHTTRLMELVAVVTSGWDLTVPKNVLIVMRPVKSVLLQTLTSVSSARTDSPLSMDTVYHVLNVVQHAQQLMEPLPTNVKAATQASVSMAMECVNHATHHARLVPAAGKPIPAHHAMKTPPWEPQDIASVTSLRSE